MDKKKTTLAVSIVAIVGAAALFTGAAMGPRGGNAETLRTVTLSPGSLTRSVSATGTVYSTDSVNVYSDLNYTVKEIHVEVGDRVEAGDILAQLDTANLSTDIAQKRASLNSSEATAQQNLQSAQQDLENYQNKVDGNYDTNLINAETSLSTAEMELRSAQADYSNAKRQLDEIEDAEADSSDLTLLQYRNTATQKAIALEKAEANYEKALLNLEAAKNTSSNDAGTYENKVKSAELSTDFSDQWIALSKLEKDLANCTVAAPVSGTVTSVQAVEGKSGSGLLFVIQDTDSLKVVTNIKEYDIASVAMGDRVTIKSDATGNQVFTGVLTKIAPTSTKSATGEVSTSTDAEYEAEVTVDEGAAGLLIGMNARLSIILEEKENVYSVPYEAVGTNPDGSSYIFVAAEDSKGGYTARQLTVDTGLETDLYIELISDELTEGMIVIRNIQGIEPGAAVSVAA